MNNLDKILVFLKAVGILQPVVKGVLAMTTDLRISRRNIMDPFESALGLFSDFGGLLADSFENGARRRIGVSGGILPVEVKMLEDGAIAKFDLPPEVKPEDVKVKLNDGFLEVAVTRHSTVDTESYFSDRRSEFYRGVMLKEDRAWEPVSAEIINGVLEVSLTSRQEDRKFNIPVTSSENKSIGSTESDESSDSKESMSSTESHNSS